MKNETVVSQEPIKTVKFVNNKTAKSQEPIKMTESRTHPRVSIDRAKTNSDMRCRFLHENTLQTGLVAIYGMARVETSPERRQKKNLETYFRGASAERR